MNSSALLFVVLLNTALQVRASPFETRADAAKRYDQQELAVTTKKAQDNANGDIVFPDQMRTNFSAEGKGFNCIEGVCENAMDYPTEHILQKLKNSSFHNFLGFSEGAYFNTTTRFNVDEQDMESLCATSLLTKYPQTLKNENNVAKYIVNVDNYKQGVIFEVCTKNAHCREASFPAGYETKCVQKYTTRRLLAIENEGDKDPAYDSFVIPSCCVCSYAKKKL